MVISGMNVNYIYEPAEKTALFLEGWNAPLSVYAPLFDYLRKKGYGIAAFDMPGVGETCEPRSPLTLSDYVSFTLEFCKNVGLEKALLVCHSNGGRIALSMLADENCPLKCEKAIFIDAAGVREKPSFKARASLAGYKKLRFLGTAKPFSYLFDELYEYARDKRSSADYKAASPVMKKTMSNLLSRDLRPLMPKISADVLLVYGDLDTATPVSHGKAMETLINNSGLAVIPGAGHFSFADCPGAFYAVLDAFL